VPELPEVETVCRGLNQFTQNQLIQGGKLLLACTLAYPFSSSEFFAAITESTLSGWERRGKYLLANLTRPTGASGGWLGVHLRMTGQLLWVSQSQPISKHTRLRLFCPNYQELRFVDIRTFGKVWWVPPDRDPPAVMTGLRSLGVEPFSTDFSVSYFIQRLKTRTCSIKALLLNQNVVAGLGNIYADESLFKSKILPTTPAQQLTTKQVNALHDAIISVLETAIASGGTTFSNFRGVTGLNGNYGGKAWVYGRKGEPCLVCNHAIESIKLAGRSTHFCPACQNNK
jgi:formamidopyrimidine-DNA glycosylase